MDTKHNSHFFWKSGNAQSEKIKVRSSGPDMYYLRQLHAHLRPDSILEDQEEEERWYEAYLKWGIQLAPQVFNKVNIKVNNFVRIGHLLLYWSEDGTVYRFLQRRGLRFRVSIVYKSRERAIKVYKADGIVWAETFDVNPPTVDQDDQQTTVSSNSQQSGTV